MGGRGGGKIKKKVESQEQNVPPPPQDGVKLSMPSFQRHRSGKQVDNTSE